jgi:hypothetical protein
VIPRRAGLGLIALCGLAIDLGGQEPAERSPVRLPDSSPIRSGTVLFAVGAGALDGWDTEFEVRGGAGVTGVQVGIYPPPQACPLGCAYPAIVIDTSNGARGTAAASEIFPGLSIFSIWSLEQDDLHVRPVRASARVFHGERPEHAADLPLVDYRTLYRAQPPGVPRDRNRPRPTLTFPVRREAGRHTNLVLATIEGENVFVRIDVLDAAGAAVRTFAPRGPRPTGAIDLSEDVLSDLPDDFEGTLRITRNAREGLFWATLANVYDDGRLELLAPRTGMTVSGGAP